MSVKHARKHEPARRTRSMIVRERVTESQVPFWVKMGTSIWKAKRVPEGRSLAMLAVLFKVWEMARCWKDFSSCTGASGVSGSVSELGDESGDVAFGAGLSATDGCLLVVDLGLRFDILGLRKRSGGNGAPTKLNYTEVVGTEEGGC